MADQALVSVVMPAYNAEAFIDEALQSVLSQDYPSFEILVVDDGSTDTTARRVAAYQKRVRYYQQANSGGFPGSPRNAGIRNSRGELICFLDADDIMMPGRLRLQADFLRAHPHVGVAFCNYQNFSTAGAIGDSHFQTCPRLQETLGDRSSVVLPSSDATALLLKENVGIPSSMMISRDALDVAPGFSTDFRVGEDFHFYYRIVRHLSLGIVDHVLTRRRIHSNNITGDSIRMLHAIISSRSDLRASEQSPVNRNLIEEFLLRCEINLADAYADRGLFSRSVAHNLRALRGAFPRRLGWSVAGLRALIRTGALAAGLKRPPP